MISIIIPTYNRALVLKRAIESVLVQSYEDWELLIIDDGSTDDSIEINRHFLDDARICFYSFPNMGASIARNIGVGLARGEFIAFLDSDDFWSTNRLEVIYSAIQQEEDSLDYIYLTDFKKQDQNMGLLKNKYLKYKDSSQILLSHSFLGGTINLVTSKKNLMNINGFDKNLTSCQDHDIYVRLNEIGGIRFIPNAYAIICYDASNRISGKNLNKLKGHINFFKKHKEKMNGLSKLLNRKKIALVSYYCKSYLILIKYLYAWFVVWLLKKIFSLSDERDLYLLENRTIKFIKKYFK